jgi:hypothetical protein
MELSWKSFAANNGSFTPSEMETLCSQSKPGDFYFAVDSDCKVFLTPCIWFNKTQHPVSVPMPIGHLLPDDFQKVKDFSSVGSEDVWTSPRSAAEISKELTVRGFKTNKAWTAFNCD